MHQAIPKRHQLWSINLVSRTDTQRTLICDLIKKACFRDINAPCTNQFSCIFLFHGSRASSPNKEDNPRSHLSTSFSSGGIGMFHTFLCLKFDGLMGPIHYKLNISSHCPSDRITVKHYYLPAGPAQPTWTLEHTRFDIVFVFNIRRVRT